MTIAQLRIRADRNGLELQSNAGRYRFWIRIGRHHDWFEGRHMATVKGVACAQAFIDGFVEGAALVQGAE